MAETVESVLRDGLSDVMAHAGHQGSISSIERLTGGASRETWRFVSGSKRFILQRQRSGSPRDIHVEVAVLEAAREAGVPVARVVSSSRDTPDSILGEPFMVLEAVDGETIARKILRDEQFAPARSGLASQIGRAMARIHRIKHSGIGGLEGEDQLNRYVALLDESGRAHPAFEIAFRWLEAHRPRQRPAQLVHGDFRLGNLVIGEDGLRAVLDWELAHVGNPAEDLGWVCVRAWRFGGAKPVAGVGEYAELLNAYEAESGVRIDEAELFWWELFGTVKWGLMCIAQSAYHLDGLVRSHELAAIGRRVCENEYDALMMLREIGMGRP